MKELLPWYIAGPLIGLSVPLLLLVKNKQLGLSSGFRWVLANFPSRIHYFNYAKENDGWQFQLAIGICFAGFVFQSFGWLPEDRPWDDTVYQWNNALPLFVGAILVGFGSRLAGGCTAGHCIMGNAQFSASSFIATLGFFGGGWLASNFVVDWIIQTT